MGIETKAPFSLCQSEQTVPVALFFACARACIFLLWSARIFDLRAVAGGPSLSDKAGKNVNEQKQQLHKQ